MAALGKGVVAGLLIVSLLIGIGIGYGVWGVLYAPKPVTYETRKIVGLLALTGVLGTFGENSKETALLAMKDVNDWLERNGKTWRLEVIIEDTKTDAPTALSKMTSWFGGGVKFFFGPMASGECKECKTYADANHILFVSPSSTSPALREKDYLFRFCPHDFVQGPGLARLIWDAGVTHLIFTWRGDTWGDGLQSAVAERFTELGGTVYEEKVRYDPGKEDFPSEAALLNGYVQALVDEGVPLEEIGINAIAFEEIAPYMEDAAEYPLLQEVKWFGSDGTALSSKLKENTVAAGFANATKFASTLFTPGLSKYPLFDYVRAHVYEVLGRETDAYSLNTYDIVWCLALAIDKAGYDPDAVKEILPEITDERTALYAASGHIVLDENGDRAFADYDIWIINEKLEWEKVGVWRSTTDTIEWIRTIYG
jgi:branched-chain amino acid transport system substrate-binding protein